MKIAIHAPFSSVSQESGFLYLLARYLHASYPSVVQVRCNGLFSLCDRDVEGVDGGESNSENHGTHGDSSSELTRARPSAGLGRRTMSSCLRCINDARQHAAWAEIEFEEISRYLTPEETLETKKWISSVPTRELTRAQFEGVAAYQLVKGSLRNRFGIDGEAPRFGVSLGSADGSVSSPAGDSFGSDRSASLGSSHEGIVRRSMLSALRMSLASRRFAEKWKPDLTFVAGGDDFISRSFMVALKEADLAVARLHWDVASRAILIDHPHERKSHECRMLIEKVTSLRSECKTWPPELISAIDQILEFLGVVAEQLPLMMAR